MKSKSGNERAKLLALADRIVADSLHPDAKGFDAGKWLGEWLERPQRYLGDVKPYELLDLVVNCLVVRWNAVKRSFSRNNGLSLPWVCRD